ncbi:hypothetical protein Tco_1549100 [Tanacetum coccineum]
MFANMRLNFHGDSMPLLASMLAPAQPAIAGESSRDAEPSDLPNVPATVTETVHSHEQVSTPPRPAPTNTDVQQNEQGPFSDPTSTQAHDSIPDPVPSTNVEDESLGGTFFATLLIENLESELQAHKLLFKEVMGKLVKRVKFLESKLKARGRKVHIFYSLSAQLTYITPIADIPTGASTHTTAFGSETDVPTGPTFEFSADPFNKGKSPMIDEDPPIKPRYFRQLEGGTVGSKSAKKLYEEEQAELTRDQDGKTRKRQEKFLIREYYTLMNWIHIMGQLITPPHSPEVTPVSPPKPSDAAPFAAASYTEVPPAVPRTTVPRTRSHFSVAATKSLGTRKKSLAPRKMPSSEVLLIYSGGSSVGVWDDQKEWVIYRWKLFPFSGVHVLETFAGKILYMFTDTPYPLSASLMKKMLKHKLEVEVDSVGNDMTLAVQLI